MQLTRVLALSAALGAAVVTATGAAAQHAPNYEAPSPSGRLAQVAREIQRSSALVQRLFFAEPVQLVVVDVEDASDELSRDEQQLACLSALRVLRQRDALKAERQQLAQRLRSPFKRAYQVLTRSDAADEVSCGDLEDPRLVDGCSRVVDMEQAVRAFMARGRSDAQVCALVTQQQQQPEEEKDDVVEIVAIVDGELSCKLCKRFVKMVTDALAQEVSQVQVVREIIGDICDSLSPDSMCHTFLNQYDQIVQWLKAGTDPALVCSRLTMCGTAAEAPLTDLAAIALRSDPESDHACAYCGHITYVVSKINEIAPSKLNFARKLVEWGCQITPKQCKCDVLVTNYDKIVAWVKQGKTPRVICQALKLCELGDEQLAIGAADNSVQDALNALVPLIHPGLSQDTKQCFLCDYVTTLLQIALQEQPDAVNEVCEYADLICGILGADNVCHQYVDKLDMVVDALKKGKHPPEICVGLKYCGAKTVAAEMATTPATAFSLTTGQDEKTCLYCDYAALVLQIILQQDAADVDEFRQYADMICGFMGADNVCHQYVDKLDAMIDALKQGKHPREICVSLKYCTAKAKAIPAPVQSALTAFVAKSRAVDFKDDKKCFYCDYVVTLLQVILQEDADQVNEIREYADMLCGILGPDNICHQYVDKLDMAIDALKKGKHPREICAALKYCSAKTHALPAIASGETDLADFDQQLVKIVASAMESAIDGCFVCTQLANLLEVALAEDPSQIDQIRQIGDLCHPVMDELGKVIDSLMKGEKPKAICQDMKFCEPKLAALSISPFVKASDGSCTSCNNVVEYLELALKHTPDVVETARALEGAKCDRLPLDDRCHEDLKMFDIAVAMLKQGKKPHDVCLSLKFCDKAEQAALLIADLKVLDSSALVPAIWEGLAEIPAEGCLFCTYFASLLEDLIANDRGDMIELLEKKKDKICFSRPPEWKCHEVMNNLGKTIELIKKGEKPEAACKDMKFCGSKAITSPSVKAGNTSCPYCNGVVTVLELALEQKPDEVKEAREAAGIVCGLLPTDDQCHEDLKLFDTAVAMLKQGKKPHEVCLSLKFCDKAEQATSLKVTDLKVLDPSVAPSRCTLCKQNSLLLASMVGEPSRLSAFTEQMHSVCRLIPDSKECELLLKHRGTIVDALKNDEDVDAICTRIHECGAATKEEEEEKGVVSSEKAISMSCLFCEYTAELVKHAAKNQNELRLAKVALETMCTILPPAARCDVLSSKFDELVALAQSGKSPKVACEEVSLCSAATVEVADAWTQTEATTPRPDYLLPTGFAPATVGDVVEVE
ncbi:hypothetical protein PybrP1_008029 [[Pythium] brassicae (nom. inval.)]|nr:hypothetical protein PybrP1_008029 [[Pythium] brassicae (nom. inval.)]